MTKTPLQRALMLAIPAYRASLRLLSTPAERDTLRNCLCTAIARDYLRDSGLLDDQEQERAA